MSSHSSPAAARQVPADANALVERVWPIGASRDDAGHLRLGGITADELAARFGTPLYVLDEDEVRATARRVREAFDAAAAAHGTTARVYYASKAFLSTAVVTWVLDDGLTTDVAPRAELAAAPAAAPPPARARLHRTTQAQAPPPPAPPARAGTHPVPRHPPTPHLAAPLAPPPGRPPRGRASAAGPPPPAPQGR